MSNTTTEPQPKPTFDPRKYKETTRAQWETAADAWSEWGPTLRRWLGPATERMLDLARVATGARVLDVAAGAGDQTLDAARRVGPTGHVLATDLSPAILAHAARAAASAGLTNVTVREMDGERVDLPEGSFDVAISRVGLIYFPDQHLALTNILRVLKPGGRFGAIVYSTADANGFFSVPVSIIRRRAMLGPPLPGQPGPFSLGAPGVLQRAYERAGFRDVRVEVVSAPLRFSRATECVRFEKESFGALHQMLGGASASEQTAAWDEIETELARFEQPDGFVGPCELVIAIGTK